MLHDLVVIVPGIMGSTLQREGKDVWNLTPHALKHLIHPGRALDGFKLPPGIGDAEPTPEHALTPGALIRRPRVLPGLVSHLGYGELCDKLRIEPERLAVFSYDWRLSNRLSAEKLKVFVERHLAEWRELVARRHCEADEAKVVFLARSMGGLITRYYLEQLGGREIARTVVTMGTPHQGTAKALRFLTGTLPGGIPSHIGQGLAELCGSFPSIAQLLPIYRAVLRPEFGRREDLDTVDVPGIETMMVRDAFAFHREIRDAQARNEAAGQAGYKLLTLGGGTHPTVHGVSVSGGRLTFLDTFPEQGEWIGDGTVPQISATPAEFEDMGHTMWFPYRHAALANESAVLLQLRMVCNGLSLRQTLATEPEFGIDIPDVAISSKPLVVKVSPAEPEQQLTARLFAADGSRFDTVRLRSDGQDGLRGELNVPTGVWTVEVGSDQGGIAHRDVVIVTDA